MKNFLLVLMIAFSLLGCRDNYLIIKKKTSNSVPVYQLPEGWARRQDSDNQAYFTKAKSGAVSFTLGAYSSEEASPTAESTRDASYRHTYCAPDVEDPLINCAKGFQKKEITIDNIKVYLFQRYGELFDLNLLATEAYWEKDGQLRSMLITGDFEEALPALTSVLRTLHYE